MSSDPVKTPVQDAISQILLNGLDAAKNGAEWLKGQIPDVIQQFLYWNAAKDAVYIVMGIFLFILGIYLSSKIKKEYLKMHSLSEYYNDSAVFGTWFVLLLGIFIGTIMVITNSLDIIEIFIAPKVYLLEYATRLLASHH
jgi:hypothetical protein